MKRALAVLIAVLALAPAAEARTSTVWLANDTDVRFDRESRRAESGWWVSDHTDYYPDPVLPRGWAPKYYVGQMESDGYFGNIAGEVTYRGWLDEEKTWAYVRMRFWNPFIGSNTATCSVTDANGKRIPGWACGYTGSIAGMNNEINYRIVQMPVADRAQARPAP